MLVEITLRFDTTASYEEWLTMQAGAVLRATPSQLTPEVVAASAPTTPETQDGSPPTRLPEAAPTPAPEEKSKSRRARRPRRTAEQKRADAAVKAGDDKGDAQEATTEQNVLPVAPVATETAPTDGERVYTLTDSREVLTNYLATEGNGAESLLKELKVHNAKRINEVPSEHLHGFLKRMVEAS